MELGVTLPLQRLLKRKAPAYGTEPDRRFCWDLHVIDLRGRKCLLAVHCHSRYTFVRYDGTSAEKVDDVVRAVFLRTAREESSMSQQMTVLQPFAGLQNYRANRAGAQNEHHIIWNDACTGGAVRADCIRLDQCGVLPIHTVVNLVHFGCRRGEVFAPTAVRAGAAHGNVLANMFAADFHKNKGQNLFGDTADGASDQAAGDE